MNGDYKKPETALNLIHYEYAVKMNMW